MHPIEDTPLCVAFPWISFLTGCGVPEYPKYRNRPDEEAGDEEAKPLLSQKTLKDKKPKHKKKNAIQNKEVFEAEPLAQLGVGIVTYQHILWTLSCVFLIFSIMLLPTASYFSSGNGYKGENPKFSKYESGMLGNMGYSSVQCTSIPLDLGKLNIQCPFGTVGKFISYGVNLSDDTANNCVE